MTLTWLSDHSDSVTIDGVNSPARWLNEATILDEVRTGDTTWTITAPGPSIYVRDGRTTIMIAPAEAQSRVTATSTTIPARYIGYEEAMKGRMVLTGVCEGLF